MENSVIQNLKTIELESPVDKIIAQLRKLIISGQLKPGDRLPPERILAERFGIGRSYIREAILKLEFYGLLTTSPQSGTYVAGYSLKIMDRIFTDIINFNKDDFAALIEARFYIETNVARLAAERRTTEDLVQLKQAQKDFEAKASNNENAVDEDMIFHIKIAKAAGNTVLESMILILIPDLIRLIVENKICKNRSAALVIKEHNKILNAIIKQDGNAAAKAMEEHLKLIMGLRKTI